MTGYLDIYLRQFNIRGYDGCMYDEGSFLITVPTSEELTTEEQEQLNNIINDYVDPPYYLQLTRTNSVPLYSEFTNKSGQNVVNGNTVMQTYIFNGNAANENSEYIDCIKTIFEYRVDNVQNFANTTAGSIYFEIYDITRNQLILSRDINLGSIATEWNALAQTGSTEGSTMYRSEQFYGLMNMSPGYDCIWQMRGNVDPPDAFDFKINSYQELYYNKRTK